MACIGGPGNFTLPFSYRHLLPHLPDFDCEFCQTVMMAAIGSKGPAAELREVDVDNLLCANGLQLRMPRHVVVERKTAGGCPVPNRQGTSPGKSLALCGARHEPLGREPAIPTTWTPGDEAVAHHDALKDGPLSHRPGVDQCPWNAVA